MSESVRQILPHFHPLGSQTIAEPNVLQEGYLSVQFRKILTNKHQERKSTTGLSMTLEFDIETATYNTLVKEKQNHLDSLKELLKQEKCFGKLVIGLITNLLS